MNNSKVLSSRGRHPHSRPAMVVGKMIEVQVSDRVGSVETNIINQMSPYSGSNEFWGFSSAYKIYICTTLYPAEYEIG